MISTTSSYYHLIGFLGHVMTPEQVALSEEGCGVWLKDWGIAK